MLSLLPSPDVGIWIVLLSLVSFTQLLELNFQSTIARAAAYLQAGAIDLGIEPVQSRGNVMRAEPAPTFAEVVGAS
jgi:hypothetical protein